MAADPTSFDHFRRGEPLSLSRGVADPNGFDYFRRGSPPPALIAPVVLGGRGPMTEVIVPDVPIHLEL